MSDEYEIINENMNILSKLDELINDLKKGDGVGAGQIFKYKDMFVDIEVAESEYWLNYASLYIIECIKDKRKHFVDHHDFSNEQVAAVRIILDELLEQVD